MPRFGEPTGLTTGFNTAIAGFNISAGFNSSTVVLDDALPTLVSPGVADYRWMLNDTSGTTATAYRGAANITGLLGVENVCYTWTGSGLKSTIQNQKVVAVSSVDATVDTLTLSSPPAELVSGVSVKIASTGSVPAGTVAGTIYGVNISAGVATLYDTAAHGLAGGATGKIDLTDTGSGTITLILQDIFNFAAPNGTLGSLADFTAYLPFTLTAQAASTPFSYTPVIAAVGDGTTSGAASTFSWLLRLNPATGLIELLLSDGTNISTLGVSNNLPLNSRIDMFIRYQRGTAGGTDSIAKLDYTFDGGGSWFGAEKTNCVATINQVNFELRAKLSGNTMTGTRHDMAFWSASKTAENIAWLASVGPEDTTY